MLLDPHVAERWINRLQIARRSIRSRHGATRPIDAAIRAITTWMLRGEV